MKNDLPSQDAFPTPRSAAAARDEAALRDVLRRVRASNDDLDLHEIVIPDAARRALFFELTRLFDIPCTFDPGVPLHYSKAARTVACWLRWIAEGFAGAHLIRMMYDGIPAPQDVRHEGERGGRLQMAALLRRAGIGSGRERLLEAVDGEIETMRTDASADGQRALRQALANRRWLERLLEVTPSPDGDGRLSLHAVARGAHEIVTRLCRDAYPGEELALARLAELMTELQRTPEEMLPPADAAERVLSLLRGNCFPMVLQAPGSDALHTISPLPGHLHACRRPSGKRARSITVDDAAVFAPPEAPKPPVLRFPAIPPLTEAESWLQRCATEEPAAVRDALRAWSPLLREGARAMEARRSDDFTQWDGHIGAGTLDADAHAFSEAALRRFGHCPYAFFLEYVLEVRRPAPWEDPQGPVASDEDARSLPEEEAGRLRTALSRALDDGAFPHALGTHCDGCPFGDLCAAERRLGSDELRALREAMRALTDPENPLFVVAFLRGPLCGADDRALLEYRRAGGLFAFNARAIPDMDARIADGLQYIKDTVRLVRSNPPGMVIASMIDRLALPAVMASGESGPQGAAMLQALQAEVFALSVSGSSLPEIVAEIDPLLSRP